MKIDKLICIPELHGELLPCPAPAGVFFMQPGLLEKTGSGQITPDNLPLGPAQARAVLRGMLEFGQNLGPKLLKDSGLAAHAPESGAAESAARKEKAALAEFAQAAVTQAVGSDAFSPSPAALENAQKVLLLAWELESNLVEIRAAERELAAKDRRLLEALGPEAGTDERAEAAMLLQGGYNSDIELPWKKMLEAVAAFLPDDCAMISFRPEIYEELEENGLLAQVPDDLKYDLPAVFSEFARPEFQGLGLRCCTAPLWKLLGGSAPDAALLAEKPWLGKTYHLLVATGCTC